MSFITIYITHPNQATAEKISNVLVEQRLVACANIFPIQSAYWWKGEITKDEEVVTLVKTVEALWPKVVQVVQANHPYDVPCMMKSKVEANEEYEDWIRNSVKKI